MNKIQYEPLVGDSIHDIISAMIQLSWVRNTPVEAMLNGVKLSVTGEMSLEEGVALYDKILERNLEEYRNSPQAKAAAEQWAAERERIMLESVEVDELVKDEVLELSAEKEWKLHLKLNNSRYGAAVMRYAERWAKLMQVEMRARQAEVLTKEIVDATRHKADNEGMYSHLSLVRGKYAYCIIRRYN